MYGRTPQPSSIPAKPLPKRKAATKKPNKLLEQRIKRHHEAAKALFQKKLTELVQSYANFRVIAVLAMEQLRMEFMQELESKGFTNNHNGENKLMKAKRANIKNTKQAVTQEQMISLLDRVRRGESDASSELRGVIQSRASKWSFSTFLLDMAKEKYDRLANDCDLAGEVLLHTKAQQDLKKLEAACNGPIEKLLVEHLQFSLLVGQCNRLLSLNPELSREVISLFRNGASESDVFAAEIYKMLCDHRNVSASNSASVSAQSLTA